MWSWKFTVIVVANGTHAKSCSHAKPDWLTLRWTSSTGVSCLRPRRTVVSVLGVFRKKPAAGACLIDFRRMFVASRLGQAGRQTEWERSELKEEAAVASASAWLSSGFVSAAASPSSLSLWVHSSDGLFWHHNVCYVMYNPFTWRSKCCEIVFGLLQENMFQYQHTDSQSPWPSSISVLTLLPFQWSLSKRANGWKQCYTWSQSNIAYPCLILLGLSIPKG